MGDTIILIVEWIFLLSVVVFGIPGIMCVIYFAVWGVAKLLFGKRADEFFDKIW